MRAVLFLVACVVVGVPAAIAAATAVTTWWFNARFEPRMAGED